MKMDKSPLKEIFDKNNWKTSNTGSPTKKEKNIKNDLPLEDKENITNNSSNTNKRYSLDALDSLLQGMSLNDKEDFLFENPFPVDDTSKQQHSPGHNTPSENEKIDKETEPLNITSDYEILNSEKSLCANDNYFLADISFNDASTLVEANGACFMETSQSVCPEIFQSTPAAAQSTSQETTFKQNDHEYFKSADCEKNTSAVITEISRQSISVTDVIAVESPLSTLNNAKPKDTTFKQNEQEYFEGDDCKKNNSAINTEISRQSISATEDVIAVESPLSTLNNATSKDTTFKQNDHGYFKSADCGKNNSAVITEISRQSISVPEDAIAVESPLSTLNNATSKDTTFKQNDPGYFEGDDCKKNNSAVNTEISRQIISVTEDVIAVESPLSTLNNATAKDTTFKQNDQEYFEGDDCKKNNSAVNTETSRQSISVTEDVIAVESPLSTLNNATLKDTTFNQNDQEYFEDDDCKIYDSGVITEISRQSISVTEDVIAVESPLSTLHNATLKDATFKQNDRKYFQGDDCKNYDSGVITEISRQSISVTEDVIAVESPLSSLNSAFIQDTESFETISKHSLEKTIEISSTNISIADEINVSDTHSLDKGNQPLIQDQNVTFNAEDVDELFLDATSSEPNNDSFVETEKNNQPVADTVPEINVMSQHGHENATERKPRNSILNNFDPFFLSSPKPPTTKPHKLDTLFSIRDSDSNQSSPKQSDKLLVDTSYLIDYQSDIIGPALPTAEDSLKIIAELTLIDEENKNLKEQLDKVQLEHKENVDVLKQNFDMETNMLKTQIEEIKCTVKSQLDDKEKIILQSQEELLKLSKVNEAETQSLKQQIEALNACVNTKNSTSPKGLSKLESKLMVELDTYRNIMIQHDQLMENQYQEMKKLAEENEQVKLHLANLEMAFADVHQKYERSKTIINGFKSNEETLKKTIESLENEVAKSEEKYEAFKHHAEEKFKSHNSDTKSQIEKYDMEIQKLAAVLKRLEIKNHSLVSALEQKKNECSALAALCDEVTGKM